MGLYDSLKSGFEGFGNWAGWGPEQAAEAKRARDRATGDLDQQRQIMEELRKGGYDPGLAENYYQSQAPDIQHGYFDASRDAAASMAQRGMGGSGANTAFQMQAGNQRTGQLVQARRAAISQATQDKRANLMGAAGVGQGIYGADSEIAAGRDQRQNAWKNFALKAGGTALGFALGGPGGAAAGYGAAGAMGDQPKSPKMSGLYDDGRGY